MFSRIVPFTFLLFLTGVAMGQNFLSWQMNDRYFSGQAGVGFSSYRGELKHNGSIQGEISNLSLGIEARLLSKIGLRVEAGRYSIRGHDKHAPDSSYARQRNLSFTSSNWELSLQGIYFLRKYRGDYYKRWRVDPYLMLGIGGTYISPQATLDNQHYNLYELQTEDEDYSRMVAVIPVGAGLKFRINTFLNFNAELTYRYSFSDYLDDVSGRFPDSYPDETTERLSNRKDEIEIVNQEAYDRLVPGTPRGDASDKDAYLFVNFKFEAFLPPGLFREKKGPALKKSSVK